MNLIISILAVLAFTIEEPKTVRIPLVDCSGSMAGERIETVKRELRQLNSQLPASPEHPIVLIGFDSRAHEPIVLTSFQEAEAKINALSATGGTNIADGLDKARQSIETIGRTASVTLIFFSDGQDANEDAIRQREREMSKIFAKRSEKGLGQTLFMKRWGGVNGSMVDHFKADRNVRFVDVESATIMAVNIDPKISLKNPQWIDPGTKLKFEIEANAISSAKLATKIPIIFDLKIDGATASAKSIRVEANGAGVKKEVIVELTKPIFKNPTQPLNVTVAAKLSDFEQPNDLVYIATLQRNQVRIPLQLPDPTFDSIVESDLNPNGVPTWIDPINGIAVFPVKLIIEVKNNSVVSIEKDHREFRLEGHGRCRIQGQPSIVVKLDRGKPKELKFEMIVPVADIKAPFQQWIHDVEIDVTPINVPGYVRYDEPTWIISIPDLAPPSAINIPVQTRLTSQSALKWTDLETGKALFRFQIEFASSRLLPTNARCISSTNHGIELKTESTGYREATVFCEVPLGVNSTDLQFIFSEGNPSGLRVKPNDLKVDIKAWPPKVRAAWFEENVGVSIPVQVALPPDAERETFVLTPIVKGPVTKEAAQRLKFQLQAKSGDFVHRSTSAFQPMVVNNEIKGVKRSFFRDTKLERAYLLKPIANPLTTESVLIPVTSIVEAPIRRLVRNLMIVIGSLSVIGLSFFSARKLTKKTGLPE